ncbi:thioredoxin family protein [Nocardioides aquiterrae]|uniref:Thioredoxin domain-containing protein n=1 Tax=Nocardioides aquiterrae TaxID=203799 RepID=A0ABN1UHN2_9ACTN
MRTPGGWTRSSSSSRGSSPAAKLVRANVEETPQRVERYEVRSVPTLVMMHRETAIARTSGAARALELRNWVEEALRSSAGVVASDR